MEVDVTYRMEVVASVSDEAYSELREIITLRNGQITPMTMAYPKAMDFLSSTIDDEEAYEMKYHIRRLKDMDS